MATEQELEAAKQRLAEALKAGGFEKGKTPPNAYVEVNGRDSFIVASSIVNHTWITADLHNGSVPHVMHAQGEGRKVHIKAQQIQHLLDQPTQASGEPIPAPPPAPLVKPEWSGPR